MPPTYDELTAENAHLRKSLERLSAVTWSGHNCSKCDLPTAETEFVVNHGLCDRCMNKMLDNDRWKELLKLLVEVWGITDRLSDLCSQALPDSSVWEDIAEDLESKNLDMRVRTALKEIK